MTYSMVNIFSASFANSEEIGLKLFSSSMVCLNVFLMNLIFLLQIKKSKFRLPVNFFLF